MGTKYDLIIEPEAGVEYGILKGSSCQSNVVFIKLPTKANIYGYRTKFHLLAKKLNRNTGFHVICAENHGDEISKKFDLDVVKKYLKNKFDSMEYRFIGIDEGATFGLSYLCHQIDFKKMLLINMPITYELENTIDLLSRVDRKNVKFVYGDKDPSYRFTPLLKRLYTDVITVKEADHDFKGMQSEFVDLYKLII